MRVSNKLITGMSLLGLLLAPAIVHAGKDCSQDGMAVTTLQNMSPGATLTYTPTKPVHGAQPTADGLTNNVLHAGVATFQACPNLDGPQAAGTISFTDQDGAQVLLSYDAGAYNTNNQPTSNSCVAAVIPSTSGKTPTASCHATMPSDGEYVGDLFCTCTYQPAQ